MVLSLIRKSTRKSSGIDVNHILITSDSFVFGYNARVFLKTANEQFIEVYHDPDARMLVFKPSSDVNQGYSLQKGRYVTCLAFLSNANIPAGSYVAVVKKDGIDLIYS